MISLLFAMSFAGPVDDALFVPSRLGTPVLMERDLATAEHMPEWRDRLARGDDSADTQAAIARMLLSFGEVTTSEMLDHPVVEVRVAAAMTIRTMADFELASTDPHGGVRAAAASVASRFEQSEAALVRLAQDESPDVRAMAVRSLGWMGSLSPIVDVAIDDPDLQVRTQAWRAIERR